MRIEQLQPGAKPKEARQKTTMPKLLPLRSSGLAAPGYPLTIFNADHN